MTNDSGRVAVGEQALLATLPEPVSASALPGDDPSRDPDPYWDYDESECWNCAGEGFVYGCSWDWQCDTYDEGEGTCLCSRPCHVCHPPKPDPALRQVLADALASDSDGSPKGGDACGSVRSTTARAEGIAQDAPTSPPKTSNPCTQGEVG